MLIRSVKSIFSSGSDEDHEAMDKVRELAERFAIEYLQRLVNNPDYPSEVVAKLMINHERAFRLFDQVRSHYDFGGCSRRYREHR